ncbi:hypothetical protein V6Z11_A13G094600 [Gossypium hirsutum]
MKKWKGQKREAKRDAVTATEKSPVRNQMRLRLRGRSAEMKRKSRTNKNGRSTIENFLTKIEKSPSGLEGLKNKERIKFNTGGIQYRRSIGFQGPGFRLCSLFRSRSFDGGFHFAAFNLSNPKLFFHAHI